jgi:hypothetical protein
MKLDEFVRPLYQDLDGASRFEEIERIAPIARTIYQPPNARDQRAFELLLLFHGLARWLEKVGNISRTVLAVPDVSEEDLRRTALAAGHLADPQTEMERAVAAAILIDGAGVRGLAQRIAGARREGHTLTDVIREAVADAWIPAWLPESARPMLEKRFEARRKFCEALLEEL